MDLKSIQHWFESSEGHLLTFANLDKEMFFKLDPTVASGGDFNQILILIFSYVVYFGSYSLVWLL